MDNSNRSNNQSSADATGKAKLTEPEITGDDIEIDEAEIRERAYEIYVERGSIDGLDENDWFQAEKELRSALKSRKQNLPDT